MDASKIYISLDEAIDKTQDVEDSIRSCAVLAVRDVVDFQGRHALPKSQDEWAKAFATRLAFFNKKYRHDTKQALVDGAQHLQRLHAMGIESGAFQRLLSAIVLALRSCRSTYVLHDQMKDLYETYSRRSSLFAQKSVLVRRAMRRIQRVVEQLQCDEESIRKTFAEWKPSLMFMCMPVYMDAGIEALYARKIHQDTFMDESQGLFGELVDLCSRRADLLREVDTLVAAQTVFFFGNPGQRIQQSQLSAAIQEYDCPKEQLTSIRTAQTIVLTKLDELAYRSKSTPSTLPGPGGVEIPIERLLLTVSEYERLTVLCNYTYQIAQSVIIDLNSVLAPL